MNTRLERLLRAASPTDHAAQTVVRAYTAQLRVGNTLLDFNGPLDATAVNQILELLDAAGVEDFTVSRNYSNMAATFYTIEQAGWKVTGMQMVASEHRDWDTGDYEQVPAWHFHHS